MAVPKDEPLWSCKSYEQIISACYFKRKRVFFFLIAFFFSFHRSLFFFFNNSRVYIIYSFKWHLGEKQKCVTTFQISAFVLSKKKKKEKRKRRKKNTHKDWGLGKILEIFLRIRLYVALSLSLCLFFVLFVFLAALLSPTAFESIFEPRINETTRGFLFLFSATFQDKTQVLWN